MRSTSRSVPAVSLATTLALSLATGIGATEAPAPILSTQVTLTSIIALNYEPGAGEVRIDFAGTPLMPGAKGKARVKGDKQVLSVDVELEQLVQPASFGPVYHTYVVWAITPDGRPENLGELELRKDSGRLKTTTKLTSFGLFVTAEPYFAVTTPSPSVVIQNVIKRDVAPTVDWVEAHAELFERSNYDGIPAATGVVPDHLAVLAQAYQAVAIAVAADASEQAPVVLDEARALIAKALVTVGRESDRDEAVALARKAVQTAHDARLIAEKRGVEQRASADRQLVTERVAEAGRLAKSAQADARRASIDRAAAERALEDANATARRTEVRIAESKEDAAAMRVDLLAQLGRMAELEETARGLVLTLPDVLFASDSASTIAESGLGTLSQLAGILGAHPALQIEVVGHTDNQGAYVYNQELSDLRSRAVFDYLSTHGAQLSQVYAYGLGETEPIASNATATGRQLNRRVQITIAGEPIGYDVLWLR